MSQVGRISGPLLTANLERQGKDLAFRNDLNTTQLLYLNVNTGKIGVNTSTPGFDFDVAGTISTTNLITDSLSSPLNNLNIQNNTISASGNITLDAAEAIRFGTLDNGSIRINDNTIRTLDTHANIDLMPQGTATTEIFNNLNIYGNLETPGNITFGGTLTLGNEDTDDVNFNADVNSDIIPDQSNTYDLGTDTKRWRTLYSRLINGQVLSADQAVVGGINVALRPGGILYVSKGGNDTQAGDSPQGSLATIKEALSRSEASGDQPLTILVLPGVYEEIAPLLVPEFVSVIGTDIRNTVVKPTSGTSDKDIFHLSDKTVISNLTIKDFTYNSTNNTGYAFRFAPNAVMNDRSPYIQDVTVLTNPTSLGGSDAGRGAWIDGDELNSASPRATMLFHSTTFITPGADVINMTNGVRVEWLNSFTYFANRGLYAFNGTEGRTSIDGSTTIYGAELRSIGSANVYGTYGAVADGANCLMYLIQHNFAYIGAGVDRTNDLDLVVQANEVVETNSGKIHHVSTDQVGNFRVGDNFFVNLETGDTSLTIDTANIDTLSGLVINSLGGTTTIDSSYITTGNIRISDNDIVSVVGDLDIDSPTEIDFKDNTNITGNLDIRDNFTFGGTLNIAGDQPGRDTAADRLVFNVEFEQDFKPHRDQVHSLGEVQRPWLETNLDKLSVGEIEIDGNVITTTESSADLELRASGTGNVVFDSSLELTNNFETTSTTNLQDLSITGTLTHVGAYNQTGDRNITGDLNVTGWLDVTQIVNLGNVQFDDNFITTTTTSANLELRANSTGKILIPYENVKVINNSSAGNMTVNNLNIAQNTQMFTANVSEITIQQNFIETNTTHANLELRASGTGIINIQDSVVVNQNLDANNVLLENGSTNYEYGPELVVNGTYDSNLTGWQQTGGGSATATGGNLRIDATGAARNVAQEITVVPGKTYDFEAQFRSVSNANAFYLRIFESGVGTLFERNETSGLINDEELTFSFVPQTTAIDIIFRSVDNIVEWDNVSMFEDIGFVTTFTPVQVNINGTNTQTGNTVQTGNFTQTGNTNASGNLTISNEITTTNFNINDNVIQNIREDLRLNTTNSSVTHSLSNMIYAMANGDTVNDFVGQTEKNIITLLANGTSAPNYALSYADVNRDSNTTTSDALAWLQYIQNGTSGDTTKDAFIKNVVEILLEDEFANPGKYNSIIFEGDYFRADFSLAAAGTGRVVAPNNDVRVTQDLFASSLTTTDITVTRDLELNEIVITDSIIEIDDNFISTTVSHADLELRAFAGKKVKIQEDTLLGQNLQLSGQSTLKNTVIDGLITHTGNRNQLGNLNIIGNITATTSNIESEIQFDDILINDNVIESTESQADLELSANGTGSIVIPENNLQINNNLSLGSLTTGSININSELILDQATLSSDIKIFDNVITTTVTSSDLELRKINPARNTLVEDFIINNNTMSTDSTEITLATTNLSIDSSKALLIPKGTTLENQNSNNSLRFNTDLNVFEGNENNNKIYFNGVFSSNRATSISAHPTNNVIDIITPGTISGEVNSSELQINGLQVDDILINNGSIQTTISQSDLDLKATGKLEIDDITFTANKIQNNGGSALVIRNTLYGTTKFSGPAVKIPAGTTAEQPSFTPEAGMTRWNTENDVLEVWDGSTFITAAGTSASISQADMDDLILEYTLIFG